MMRTLLKQTLLLALVALGALPVGAEESGSSPWYIAVTGGASTGWRGDGSFSPRFVGAPGEWISLGDPYSVKAKAKSTTAAALALGYDWAKSEAPTLRFEVEGIYQPQSFRIEFTKLGRVTTGTRRTDDMTYFGNIGVCGRLLGLQSYLLAGVGCNTSNRAYTAAAFQAKGGFVWALTSRCSLNFEARFITVPHYEMDPAKWGWALDSRFERGDFDFGSVYSLSGMLGLQYRF